MTLFEYKKKNNFTYYELGRHLGMDKCKNPGTVAQRWCLTAKWRQFPNPFWVRQIAKATNNEVTREDLYNAWYEKEDIQI